MMRRFDLFFFRVAFLMILTLGWLSCGQRNVQQAGGEAMKMAARDFRPTLMRLDTILTAGDIQAARDTLAVLMQKFDKIEAAEIPDRLKDNTEKVESQIAALAEALDQLSMQLDNASLTAIDSTVLKSYQSVRMNFSRLGGLLRFKIPELVSFHDEVLHEIWHEAYPNDDIAAIKAAVPAFKQKAEALSNIQWPAALGAQVEEIKAKVVDLQKAVNALELACQGDDAEAIKKATEEVHSLYEKIARML